MHYWATNNLEWYDPAAITTEGGDLVITLSQKETHDLHYQGGKTTLVPVPGVLVMLIQSFQE